MPCYLNADLEITVEEDLICILKEWRDSAVALCCHRQDDGSFFASFEDSPEQSDPETSILRFCELVTSLSSDSRRVWDTASRRVIDLGYQSDEGSGIVRSTVSAQTLARMASLGIEMAVTLYPPEITTARRNH